MKRNYGHRNETWLKERARRKPPKKKSKVYAFAKKLEDNPFFRISAVVVIILTLVTLVIDLRDRKEERVARAWSILNSKVPGNSGKVAALQLLDKYGEDINGIDISCETLGGEIREPGPLSWQETCRPLTYLAFLNFTQKHSLSTPHLDNLNVKGSYLRHSNLSDLRLAGIQFDGSIIAEANLSHSLIFAPGFGHTQIANTDFSSTEITNAVFMDSVIKSSTFSRSQCRNCVFDSSIIIDTVFDNSRLINSPFSQTLLLNSSFKDVQFSFTSIGSAFFDSNLSGADFSGATGLRAVDFESSYASSASPPKGLSEEFMSRITLCTLSPEFFADPFPVKFSHLGECQFERERRMDSEIIKNPADVFGSKLNAQ